MSQVESVTIRKNNSSATVHLFGATLTSWKPNGCEALFVSKNSHFDNKNPIRGGVPVIFPQFGPWENGPQHGFARRTLWSVKHGENDPGKVTLVLEESEDSLKIWNYRFKFEYTLSLVSDSELKMDAVITNRDENEFSFTFLLHTYFSVPDIEKCGIVGLKGCSYVDKVKNGAKSVEENDEIKISEFTDRVYLSTPNVNKISHASQDREITIEKCNLPDTVVWNPWIDNAKKMADFGDDEYKQMVCVEAGYVGKPYDLISGDSFRASQSLKVL
ncbi:hypothetical protein JTE90_011468 [Oedothorax gibbosus]|uniref:glucose-6-phosphate 1-epimerase n=1 Tax=Oedothorax gibbosus TaxID=931172 RepID=A0AAV6VD12_9ARAC|nr:hypothetical protein JTE90_011468 [Oedothorax gibbosus]